MNMFSMRAINALLALKKLTQVKKLTQANLNSYLFFQCLIIRYKRTLPSLHLLYTRFFESLQIFKLAILQDDQGDEVS